MKYFAKNIRFLRKKRGYTIDEISSQLDIKRTTWNGYELGTSRPYVPELINIAKYFDIPEQDLLHSDISRNVHLIQPDKGTPKPQKGPSKSPTNSPSNSKITRKEPVLSTVEEPGEKVITRYQMPQVITVDTQGNENVVLVPVKARAGYLNGYADPEFMQTLPAYRLPGLNNGSFRLFEVEGLSMYPTLHSGDLVIGSNVEQLSLLRDDRVHVVVTKNEGVVVKRVLNRIKTDGKLILKSDNYKDRDLYPPIVVDPQDILEIWYATGFLSRQMRPPAEMYNRLIDLEGRITILESNTKKPGKK